jgi:hypothetical protein
VRLCELPRPGGVACVEKVTPSIRVSVELAPIGRIDDNQSGACPHSTRSKRATCSRSCRFGCRTRIRQSSSGPLAVGRQRCRHEKVFKYTIVGSLVGSWTIDAANATPTGITIDPANVSDIWIVDSGTDRVYQYTGAATRTSGSQSAAASFQLAPGNTNPQGIADPPSHIAARFDSLVANRTNSQTAAVTTAPEHGQQAKKKINFVAREQYFESLAAERFELIENRVRLPGFTDASVASIHQLANDVVVDDAFESIFAGILRMHDPELVSL